MPDAINIDDILDWLHVDILPSTKLFAVNDSAVEKKPRFHRISRRSVVS